MRTPKRNPRRSRTILTLVCLLAAAAGCGSGWAYTAANNIASGKAAGEGSAAIAPYTITNVAYTLNTNSPQNIDQVTFTLSPIATSSISTQLATAGSWYSCTNTSGSAACATAAPQASATTANNLTIVAAQ